MRKWLSILSVLLIVTAGIMGGGYYLWQTETVSKPKLIQLSTVGPRGEAPVSSEVLYLLDSQIKEVRSLGLTAAVVLHDTQSEFSRVLIKGLKKELDDLNIDLIYLSDAGFDPYIERLQLVSAVLKGPDILITLPLDPDDLTYILKTASYKKVAVSILSNMPKDMEHPRDYAGVVTDDLFQMGRYVAEMMAHNITGTGKVALLYHDAEYYVTNQRDQAVETVLRHRFQNVEIVAKQGITSASEAREKTLAILEEHPDLDAIYVPWATLAKGSLEGLREMTNKRVKLFTIDFDIELSKDMLLDGNVKGVVVDQPYEIGRSLVRVGVLSKLGEPTPAFTTVRAQKIDKKSLAVLWREIQHEDLPAEILNEVRK